MEKFLGRFSPSIFAIFRIVTGFMFMIHGMQKIFGWPGGKGTQPLASLLGIGGLIELIGGAMILIGLFTGFAAFICSGQMAVAYFMFHTPNGFLPANNGGELAALYSFVFLYMSSRGSGTWSIDSLLKPQGEKKTSSG
jgi:putative oxidoreductase